MVFGGWLEASDIDRGMNDYAVAAIVFFYVVLDVSGVSDNYIWFLRYLVIPFAQGANK